MTLTVSITGTYLNGNHTVTSTLYCYSYRELNDTLTGNSIVNGNDNRLCAVTVTVSLTVTVTVTVAGARNRRRYR